MSPTPAPKLPRRTRLDLARQLKEIELQLCEIYVRTRDHDLVDAFTRAGAVRSRLEGRTPRRRG